MMDVKSTTPITKTDFNFSGQTSAYFGKVRDMYGIGEDLMVLFTLTGPAGQNDQPHRHFPQ